MARLKVFTTQSGFYDLAVAAASQAAALAAWGIHQNLFAEGMATVATDKAVVEAALAKPGLVVKRPLGTKGAFREDAALPKIKATRGKPKARDTAAARKAVTAANESLSQATEEHNAQLRALTDERAALDSKIAAEKRAWTARRRILEDAAKRAQHALRKAR